MAEEVTNRDVLVAHSAAAYDEAVSTPTDADAPEENWAAKLLLLLDVLVTEARLARHDRENPFDLAGVVWDLDNDEAFDAGNLDGD